MYLRTIIKVITILIIAIKIKKKTIWNQSEMLVVPFSSISIYVALYLS